MNEEHVLQQSNIKNNVRYKPLYEQYSQIRMHSFKTAKIRIVSINYKLKMIILCTINAGNENVATNEP